MSQAEHNCRIDYVEFPATDIEATKQFYSTVFGWQFEDYDPDYTAFCDRPLSGGFVKADSVTAAGPLIVIFATNLEATEDAVKSAGGKIKKETFSFPGGRRFHFEDPSGNELARISHHVASESA